MLEEAEIEAADADYAEFLATGDTATGAYQCSECGYGVTVQRELPRCPMCGGTVWEESPWRPFTRRRELR